MKALLEIQAKLKAPKGQKNSFGNYNYRSCEDILEAVKPLCNQFQCVLTISDEMIMLGDRFYVKATATIRETSGEHEISISAYARESESKKGMDASQITGSASSYARKYALNGLFCIDDTKDADTMDNRHKAQDKPKAATNEQIKLMNGYMKDFTAKNDSKSVEYIAEHLAKNDLSMEQAQTIINRAKDKLS